MMTIRIPHYLTRPEVIAAFTGHAYRYGVEGVPLTAKAAEELLRGYLWYSGDQVTGYSGSASDRGWAETMVELIWPEGKDES